MDDIVKPSVTIPNIIAAHTLNGVILNFIFLPRFGNHSKDFHQQSINSANAGREYIGKNLFRLSEFESRPLHRNLRSGILATNCRRF